VTLTERVDAFKAAYAKWPASWPWLVREKDRDVAYAVWVIGNDYKNKTRYYGSYPPGYLERVMALFPDAGVSVLHIFSGSLPKSSFYARCDSRQDAELRCSVYDLPNVMLPWRPRLVVADPPYSSAAAVQYGTPMINRGKALAAFAQVTLPGGHLAWLDTCWPMHRKSAWTTVGRILVQRSTNHRARVLSIFERVA
jgi:hypothetical protein